MNNKRKEYLKKWREDNKEHIKHYKKEYAKTHDSSFKKLQDKYKQLQQENKRLNGVIQTYDILLKANTEENKQLRNYLSTKYIEHLEQQCKKQKEVINKANKKLNNFIGCCKAEKLESGSDYIHHQYWDMFERFNKQIKDIFKEVSE